VAAAARLFGSDAKVLSAAVPVRTALDACDAMTAGLVGAADILEHPGGLLAKFCDIPAAEVVTIGLGIRWHTETLSFKMHPAGAYVDAAIDCAAELHRSLAPVELVQITMFAPALAMVMDRHALPCLDREHSAIVALNLSVPYNVATALVTGSVLLADLTEPATADPVRWAIAAKVRLLHEPELSGNLLHATAPLGEALRQANGRARDWLREFYGVRPSRSVPSQAHPAGPSRRPLKRQVPGCRSRFGTVECSPPRERMHWASGWPRLAGAVSRCQSSSKTSV
jgi:2-methylcitrate dehydratase PrpD